MHRPGALIPVGGWGTGRAIGNNFNGRRGQDAIPHTGVLVRKKE